VFVLFLLGHLRSPYSWSKRLRLGPHRFLDEFALPARGGACAARAPRPPANAVINLAALARTGGMRMTAESRSGDCAVRTGMFHAPRPWKVLEALSRSGLPLRPVSAGRGAARGFEPVNRGPIGHCGRRPIPEECALNPGPQAGYIAPRRFRCRIFAARRCCDPPRPDSSRPIPPTSTPLRTVSEFWNSTRSPLNPSSANRPQRTAQNQYHAPAARLYEHPHARTSDRIPCANVVARARSRHLPCRTGPSRPSARRPKPQQPPSATTRYRSNASGRVIVRAACPRYLKISEEDLESGPRKYELNSDSIRSR